MPVTKSRIPFYDLANLDQANTAGFLFGDEEPSEEDHQFALQDSGHNYGSSGRGDMVSLTYFPYGLLFFHCVRYRFCIRFQQP